MQGQLVTEPEPAPETTLHFDPIDKRQRSNTCNFSVGQEGAPATASAVDTTIMAKQYPSG